MQARAHETPKKKAIFGGYRAALPMETRTDAKKKDGTPEKACRLEEFSSGKIRL